jgi:hypothetical protein
MSRKRFTPEQIIGALSQAEAPPVKGYQLTKIVDSCY